MIGYCCINQTLRKQSVYTGRQVIRRLFTIEKASDLALQNARDLITILEWNVQNDIYAFRLGSNFFPRMTDPQDGYSFDELYAAKEIEQLFQKAGEIAKANHMILSCHPGPYTVLSSDDPLVAEKAIEEIHMHSLIGDMLDVDQFNINIHVGRKLSPIASDNFCRSFEKLSPVAQSRLTIENDDKPNGWAVEDLYNLIYRRTGTPITYDLHHSVFSCPVYMSMADEYLMAKSTWNQKNVEVHVSESASGNNPRKHSDYIERDLPKWIDIDQDYVLFEAKQKELAVLKYKKER